MSKSGARKPNSQKRASNYSPDECWRLVNVVLKYKNVVENKKTDAATWQEKNLAWQEIAQKFNCGISHHRTGDQLRSKFDSLKKDARKDAAKARQQYLASGGGPYIKTKVNPLFEKIKEMIQLSISEGMPSLFDNDGLDVSRNDVLDTDPFQDVGDPQVLVFKNEESNILIELGTDVKEIPYQEVQTLPIIIEANVDIHSRTSSCSTPTEAVTDGDVHNGVIEQHNGNAQETLPTKQSDKSPACRNTPWVNRRRPVLNTPVAPMSLNGQRLGLWANARKELAVMQKDLIKEEFENREKREIEIHDQLTTINKLKIKKLELDIKLQEATLNKFNTKEHD